VNVSKQEIEVNHVKACNVGSLCSSECECILFGGGGVKKFVRQPRLHIHCQIMPLLTPTAVVINGCAASICRVCTRLPIKELLYTIIQANQVFKNGVFNWLLLYICYRGRYTDKCKRRDGGSVKSFES